MDSFKKSFDDMLPDRSKCFSSSKDECINEKDYWHAADVWIMFKMNTMDDYHDLYLKADVFLLAEVFEKVIKICLECYELDP